VTPLFEAVALPDATHLPLDPGTCGFFAVALISEFAVYLIYLVGRSAFGKQPPIQAVIGGILVLGHLCLTM
jgi:hypothetical protein